VATTDNSNWAVGTFFEGVIASGFASDATDAAVHASIASAGYGQHAPLKMDDGGAKPKRRVTVWWKPSGDIASDVHGMRSRLAATDVIIYCGYAALSTGAFGVDPDPPAAWGNESLCKDAVDAATAAGMSAQIIVEGRFDGNIRAALAAGGAAFGAAAAKTIRTQYPKVMGLNLDFEVGRNRSAAGERAATCKRLASSLGASSHRRPSVSQGSSRRRAPWTSSRRRLLAR